MQKWLLVFLCIGVRCVYSQHITLAPSLRQNEVDKVLVLTADSSAFLKWATRQKLTVKKRGNNLYECKAPTSRISNFDIPGVVYVDNANRKAKEESLLGEFDFTLNALSAVQSRYTTLGAKDITISIKEKPFDVEDLDIKGRIALNNQFDEAATLHATFMATLAAGGGNTSPNARGAGWQAHVTTSDFNDLLPDPAAELAALQVTVQNHSYGVGLENYYGLESQAYDQAVLERPEILHVFSSGNEGDKVPADGVYSGLTGVANLTGQFKLSKNTLAVGSVDRLGNLVSPSSRGPAHDGRIKPELVAFGDAGSSESAALVSGVAAIVQQKYLDQHQRIPDAALVKAILINSATDSGRPQVDFDTGFGNVNALRAIRTVEENRFIESTIQQDETKSFTINVPTEQDELKVTFTWADPAAEPFSNATLVHDLDLSLTHLLSSQSWNPWVLNANPTLDDLQELAFRGVDRVNNVEQITISNPVEGTYQINITGFRIANGIQKFFLSYEYRSGFEWTYPVGNNALATDAETILRWQWSGTEAEAELAYRLEGSDWMVLESNLNLKQQYYEWQLPDTTSLIQFRISRGTDTYETEFVPLTKPERLQVGFNCDTEIMLQWNATSNADSYTVYELGERYLEPVATLADTFLIVPKKEIDFYSVAPGLNGKTGLREFTINYTQQGTGCYFISFRSQEYLVKDTAAFHVQLGTTYKLQSAALQRFDGSQFVTIQNLNPESPIFSLTDSRPVPGLVPYRVSLTTTDNKIINSSSEEVFFVRKSDLIVFPNPVSIQEELSVMVNTEDAVVIRLYDLNGRLLSGVEDFGVTKTIDLTDFKTGVYLLKVFKPDGSALITRLVVTK